MCGSGHSFFPERPALLIGAEKLEEDERQQEEGGDYADHAGGVARLLAHMDVERLAMDFSLPAPSGSGTPLSQEALQTLLRELSPATFYSRDLCTRYFTYAREERTHFVLYDDAETLRQKLRAGREMGLCAAFLMYPEVADLLPALFGRQSAE